jgi:hypothetical protein
MSFEIPIPIPYPHPPKMKRPSRYTTSWGRRKRFCISTFPSRAEVLHDCAVRARARSSAGAFSCYRLGCASRPGRSGRKAQRATTALHRVARMPGGGPHMFMGADM